MGNFCCCCPKPYNQPEIIWQQNSRYKLKMDLKKECQKLKLHNKQIADQINKLKHRDLTYQLQRSNTQPQRTNITHKQSQIHRLHTELARIRFDIQTAENNLRDIATQQLKLTQYTRHIYDLKLRELTRQRTELQQSIIAIGKQTDEVMARHTLNQEQATKINAQIQQLHNLITNMERKITAVQPIKRPSPHASMFVGQVLDGQLDYRQFLIEILQQRLNCKIKSTRLVYRYDQINKNDIHVNIDDKPYLVLLVKLKNGYTLGGYSQGAFRPRMVSDKDGLIFSLTNRKVFELLQRNRRAIAYQNNFMIFGNSDLRIKAREPKVYSNFGTNNSYYNTRGQKVDVLLGSGTSKQAELQFYEVFQLILK